MLSLFRKLRSHLAFAKANLKKRELAGENVVPINTRIAGMALVDGLRNRAPVCRRCLSRYTPKEREFAERFQLRAILMIPDSVPDPMMCDFCVQTTIESYNRFQSNVGTSNSGPTNLALRRLIAKD